MFLYFFKGGQFSQLNIHLLDFGKFVNDSPTVYARLEHTFMKKYAFVQFKDLYGYDKICLKVAEN